MAGPKSGLSLTMAVAAATTSASVGPVAASVQLMTKAASCGSGALGSVTGGPLTDSANEKRVPALPFRAS
jgi:hypothetical protein